MPFAVAFNDFTLDGVQRWEERDGFRIAPSKAPRKHARIGQNTAFRTRKFVTLPCEVFKDSESELETYLEDLKAAIYGKLGNLRRKQDGPYLKAILASTGGMDDAALLPGTRRTISLEFECEPMWYGDERSESFLSQAPGANNLVVNNGRAGAPPVIEVSGLSGSGITVIVTNTTIGMGMTFIGDVAAGQSIVFDHVNARIIKGGGNANEDVDIPNFWELIPGSQNIRVDAPDTFNLTIQWLERSP
jgi:hypothetical protein